MIHVSWKYFNVVCFPASRDWAIENLVPPSKEDYNFTDKSTIDFSDGRRMKSIHEKYLGAKKNGRFIEVCLNHVPLALFLFH